MHFSINCVLSDRNGFTKTVTRLCAYNIKLRHNRYCPGKAISTTYYECVFIALVIQHAKLVRRIVICGLSGLQYFSTLSHELHDSGENVAEHKTCFFDFLQILSETFLF